MKSAVDPCEVDRHCTVDRRLLEQNDQINRHGTAPMWSVVECGRRSNYCFPLRHCGENASDSGCSEVSIALIDGAADQLHDQYSKPREAGDKQSAV